MQTQPLEVRVSCLIGEDFRQFINLLKDAKNTVEEKPELSNGKAGIYSKLLHHVIADLEIKAGPLEKAAREGISLQEMQTINSSHFPTIKNHHSLIESHRKNYRRQPFDQLIPDPILEEVDPHGHDLMGHISKPRYSDEQKAELLIGDFVGACFTACFSNQRAKLTGMDKAGLRYPSIEKLLSQMNEDQTVGLHVASEGRNTLSNLGDYPPETIPDPHMKLPRRLNPTHPGMSFKDIAQRENQEAQRRWAHGEKPIDSTHIDRGVMVEDILRRREADGSKTQLG